jgi:hypothetical protein
VVRRLSILAALAAVAGGCGGGSASSPAPASSPQPDAAARASGARVLVKARELVFFQRQGAAGATLDTISVRVDGTARHEKRYGGAGGRFKDEKLEPGQLAKLRRDLARLPRGDSLGLGAVTGGATYLMRYDGRTRIGRAGGILRAARPVVKRLDGYIDGEGVGKPSRENATHAPG